jgi:hypothetical protein
VVKESLYLLDMAGCTTDTIDALDIETEEIDSLHALINNHGDSCLISVVEVVKADTKDRLERRGQRSRGRTRRCGTGLGSKTLLSSHGAWSCR